MAELDSENLQLVGRVQPHNKEAERAILGAMMISEDAYYEVLELLKMEHFYAPAHRKIYDALKALSGTGQPVDSVTVLEALKRSNELEQIGGASYLAELTMEIPSISHVGHYAKIVKEKSQLRTLAQTALEISDFAFAGGDVDEAYQIAESRLTSLSDARLTQSAGPFSDMLENALTSFEERRQGNTEDMGIAPPWPTMSRLIHGFKGGEMIVVAARPSMGKTSFSLNLIIDFCLQQKHGAAFFSLEMTAQQIVDNILCIDAQMDGNKWRKPSVAIEEKEIERINNSVQRLSQTTVFIDDDPMLTPTVLRSKVRRMKREHDIRVVFIDYLQLMNDDQRNLNKNDGRTQEMSNISRQLKAIAKEFEIPIFALAQLNRSVEQRTEKVPRMSDLRESGSIEQDADVVILLNRPEYYSLDKNNPIRPGEADIIVAKNRHGDVGTTEMRFIKNMMTFAEKDRD